MIQATFLQGYMSDWNIPTAEIERYYKVLHTIGCLGDDPTAGFLRAAYSAEETAAMKYIEGQAQELGALVRWDALGNLFLEWPGKSGRFAEIGSHLDTVPLGGNFDGAAGIVAGLAAIKKILEVKPSREHGLRLRIWRGEESSTFNALFIGSLGAFGGFNAKSLSNRFQGKSLEEAMTSQGVNPEIARRGEPTISQEEIDSIIAHVELHIEQGNLLEVEKKDVGVVTSIRGPSRLRVSLYGEFDHSGATPMGLEYRKDCNLALAYIMVRLNELAQETIKKGSDLVQTVGVINASRDINEANTKVYQNALPKVSGYAYFTLDIRSSDSALLKSYTEKAKALITNVASEFRVTAEIETISYSDPLEALDGEIQHALSNAADTLQISWRALASGAGHDAAIVGRQVKTDRSKVPVGMLFIPCRGGKSHCPTEYTTYDAIAKGASVLALSLSSIVCRFGVL